MNLAIFASHSSFSIHALLSFSKCTISYIIGRSCCSVVLDCGRQSNTTYDQRISSIEHLFGLHGGVKAIVPETVVGALFVLYPEMRLGDDGCWYINHGSAISESGPMLKAILRT
jgi:hypothetical protein